MAMRHSLLVRRLWRQVWVIQTDVAGICHQMRWHGDRTGKSKGKQDSSRANAGCMTPACRLLVGLAAPALDHLERRQEQVHVIESEPG